MGPRVYSRLHELCDFIDVVGTDYRREQHDERERAQATGRRGLPQGEAAKAVRIR